MVSAQCKRARCARLRRMCVRLSRHAVRSLVGRRPESSCRTTGSTCVGLGGVDDAAVMEHTDRQEVGQGPRHLWKQGNDDLGKGGVSKPLFFCVQLIHDKCGFCGGRHAC